MTEAEFLPATPPAYHVPESLDADLVILPREIDEDGMGLYEGILTDAVKRLRVEGVKAAYMHEADERDWIGEKGFAETALGIIIAATGEAVWEGVKKLVALLRSDNEQGRAERPLKLKVGSYTTRPDGTFTHEWLEIEGSFEQIEKALGRIRPNAIEPKVPEE